MLLSTNWVWQYLTVSGGWQKNRWPDTIEQSIHQWAEASRQYKIYQWLDMSEQSIFDWPIAATAFIGLDAPACPATQLTAWTQLTIQKFTAHSYTRERP